MRLTAIKTLWSLSILATVAPAQDTLGLSDFSECARECISDVLDEGLCSSTNQTCICTNTAFQNDVALCVTASCGIPETLVVRNTTSTHCGAPVRNRSQELVAVSNTMAILAGLFIALRFGYKIWNPSLSIGMDDWFVLATMLAATPTAVITVYGTTPNGLGRDIWTLTPTQITDVVRFFYVTAVLYFAVSMFLKLSIISFYLRVFPSKEVQRVLWATFALTCVWGAAFVILGIFQCWPIPYFWTKWDGMHEGKCADINAISWSHAGMSISLDFWILAIPLWQLRKLHLNWKKKVPIAIMFCLGTFVTVVSILRLQSLITFGTTDNSTWEFYGVTLWSTVEICVGIITTCLPTIRIILVRIFPMLSGSSYASKGAYYNRRSGIPSGIVRSGRHEVSVATSQRPSSEQGGESPSGITLQKSFTVQYSDNDETSLVAMTDLQPPAKTWHPDSREHSA